MDFGCYLETHTHTHTYFALEKYHSHQVSHYFHPRKLSKLIKPVQNFRKVKKLLFNEETKVENQKNTERRYYANY